MDKPKRPYGEEVWIDFENLQEIQKLMFDQTKEHFPGMEHIFITGTQKPKNTDDTTGDS